jgi:hypothetical protein
VNSWNASGEEAEVEVAASAGRRSAGAEPDSAQETAEFDALPVLARGQVLTPTYYRAGAAEPRRPAEGPLPAVRAAAAAAGGFVAGAVLVSFVQRLVQRRHRRALARRGARRGAVRARRSPPQTGELLQVVASRSLLVDVHVLGDRR